MQPCPCPRDGQLEHANGAYSKRACGKTGPTRRSREGRREGVEEIEEWVYVVLMGREREALCLCSPLARPLLRIRSVTVYRCSQARAPGRKDTETARRRRWPRSLGLSSRSQIKITSERRGGARQYPRGREGYQGAVMAGAWCCPNGDSRDGGIAGPVRGDQNRISGDSRDGGLQPGSPK